MHFSFYFLFYIYLNNSLHLSIEQQRIRHMVQVSNILKDGCRILTVRTQNTERLG